MFLCVAALGFSRVGIGVFVVAALGFLGAGIGVFVVAALVFFGVGIGVFVVAALVFLWSRHWCFCRSRPQDLTASGFAELRAPLFFFFWEKIWSRAKKEGKRQCADEIVDKQ